MEPTLKSSNQHRENDDESFGTLSQVEFYVLFYTL